MSSYERTGVLCSKDLKLPTLEQLEKGVAILECVQEIPCNPCVAVCPVDAVSMEDINAFPLVDYDKCIGCTLCVGICPGLAIFVVKIVGKKAHITLPYEFLPVPRVGDRVKALDREGKIRSDAKIIKVVRKKKTAVVTVEVDKSLAMEVRNIKVK